MSDPRYRYSARVVSVYDGDTVRLDIDLGFKTWVMNQPFRLARINTPEVRGPERPQGLVSRDWLREQIPVDSWVLAHTIKDKREKYGRMLVNLYQEKADGQIICLNDELVYNGLAKYYP